MVRVLGAGPAGGAAALAALEAGVPVEIFEKSAFPRHKVCGEFLSPQSAVLLDRLGVWRQLSPWAAPMRSMLLSFRGVERRGPLPETAWGVSRSLLDRIVLESAVARGARVERAFGEPGPGATVIATGRRAVEPKGQRLFGFKAHFAGPATDQVELYFFGDRSYLGVSPIEDGLTNVCGLAPEEDLRAVNFEIEALLQRTPAVRDRLNSLRRCWDWLHVGPLQFRSNFEVTPRVSHYPCGDCLAFVDPFTGSGILSALLTGSLAGSAAAMRLDPALHVARCREKLRKPLLSSQLFRRSITAGWARYFMPWIPLSWLFWVSRPTV